MSVTREMIGIYGASGFGREIMPLVRKQYPNYDVCFVDDGNIEAPLNACGVYSYSTFLSMAYKEKHIVLAIANSQIREKLAKKCQADNINILSVKAENSLILDGVKIGEGAILCSFTHLTSNIKIGKQFHANIYSYVAHDCVIGDYVTFAPSVHCNGNVHIEDHAYIGTGAIIKQGTPDKPLVIGKGAVVGMGAVVTKNVPAGVTVIGNPAKPFVKN